MSASTGLQAALDYAERDFALLPIRPRTKEPHYKVLFTDRRPGRRSGIGLHHAPRSRRWFEADAKTGIGNITGSASDGLVVLDINCEHDGLRLPAAPTVRTGGGSHVYLELENRRLPYTRDGRQPKGRFVVTGVLAVLKYSSSRRLTEVAFLLAAIAGAVLVASAVDRIRRLGLVAGGALLAVGTVLLIIAVHYGVNPYRHGPVRAKK